MPQLEPFNAAKTMANHEAISELIRALQFGDPLIVGEGEDGDGPYVIVTAPNVHFKFTKQADGSYTLVRSPFSDPV
ncbi:hypothetical protein [Burkholderia ambifaria]|uniref:hypothetical protein n=1 Tax=Burkholderia ambifaria TaxID=152480 RepID=UPI00158E52CA|nr:hypothetical protein [Burkholderia ambifaria]UEP53013.1 hypothetical protein LMA00_30300 [Burkholderia ambifaria]